MNNSLITTLICKSNCTIVLDINSDIWCAGNNRNIFFNNEEKISFKKLSLFNSVIMVSCGNYHLVCLNIHNEVFSIGSNDLGQLGIGILQNELNSTHIPQKINLPKIKQISCGDNFTMCLCFEGNLYSWGKNSRGELGLNNKQNYTSPQRIPGLNDIMYIECGGYYSICFSYNNKVYAWGNNTQGQLGNGHCKDCIKPTECRNWPNNIISLKCGFHHIILLTEEGRVYSCGNNGFGQLGLDKSVTIITTPQLIPDLYDIKRIECGYYHNLFIDYNNNLWVFGYNSCGQLGLGNTTDVFTPIRHSLNPIIDISSGGNHSFVKTIDNKIYAFGSNYKNLLGIITKDNNQLNPIQVFQNNEDIWHSIYPKSRAKSARK